MTNMGRCEPLSDGVNGAGWCAGDLVPSTSVPAVPDELGGEESLVSQWELKR
jgi:hypothetical protein